MGHALLLTASVSSTQFSRQFPFHHAVPPSFSHGLPGQSHCCPVKCKPDGTPAAATMDPRIKSEGDSEEVTDAQRQPLPLLSLPGLTRQSMDPPDEMFSCEGKIVRQPAA